MRPPRLTTAHERTPGGELVAIFLDGAPAGYVMLEPARQGVTAGDQLVVQQIVHVDREGMEAPGTPCWVNRSRLHLHHDREEG